MSLSALGPAGRWQISHTLGAGGFATVHAALDTRFESPVAVKILAENYASNIEVRERFLSEALLQRRLAGPVVPVYDTGESSSGQPFMVMPLAEGGDLQRRVERWRAGGGTPSGDDVYRLSLILTNAIGALHAQGIVHRDLKPSNLLLFGGGPDAGAIDHTWMRSNETLLLADLGFAKDLVESSGLTVGGGTPGFLPPEQLKPGRITRRADIWGAAAILHWFITGHRPNDSAAIRRTHLLESGAGEPLTDVLELAMADDPSARPSSIEAWSRLVREALGRDGLVAPAAGGGADRSGDRGVGAGRPQRMATMAATAALAMVIGGIGGFIVSGRSTADGGSTTIVGRADGLTTYAVVDGSLEISITGPETVGLGDTALFSSGGSAEVVSRLWITPSGTTHDGFAQLPIRATRPGPGTVTLIATTGQGRTYRVEAPITVTE